MVDKVLVALCSHTLVGKVATNEMAKGGKALAGQKRTDLKSSLPYRLYYKPSLSTGTDSFHTFSSVEHMPCFPVLTNRAGSLSVP